ncbi:hypothetical protein JQ615_11560 [Bradyrhizobium jicamae]|uniref:Uncharacterized protein n=1 Tax=Bradyrhizobium jicamae TaxID=280332 RepID=A0ABS5FGW5_9BRAD|nr:hypothetical protein [Bradyrhizobium jicamae]MBR0796026.1 hypothetical protein [Bradyrhizobium jicamae]
MTLITQLAQATQIDPLYRIVDVVADRGATVNRADEPAGLQKSEVLVSETSLPLIPFHWPQGTSQR